MRAYKCRVCGGTFEAESPKGRLPRACPEHRHEAKQRVDRAKKRENYANGGPERKPLCCAEAGRQCPQHRSFTRFKRTWHRPVRRQADDPKVQIILDLFYTDAGDLDGRPVYGRRNQPGYSILE